MRKRMQMTVLSFLTVTLFATAAVLWLAAGRITAEEPLPEPSVIDVMHKLDAGIERLYHATRQEDWPNAYRHLERLEEIPSVLYGENIYVEQSNVSDIMESVMPDQITTLRERIDARDVDGFLTAYRAMVDTCNSCHRSLRQLAVVMEPPLHQRLPPE